MGWLSGYDKRIQLTIDYTKIDSDLSHFPVTVFLDNTNASGFFTELGSDSNRKKVAFTKADGTTQLYGEIELFDYTNKKAIYHVSASGWTISSSADTIFYLYYDADASDNTTYIGDIDSTAGASVWDSDFMAVWHCKDGTTTTIYDSTSNNKNLTKKGTNEPIQQDGLIGKSLYFDGSNDYLTHSTFYDSVPSATTVEVVNKVTGTTGDDMFIVSKFNQKSDHFSIYCSNDNKNVFRKAAGEDSYFSNYDTGWTQDVWQYLVASWNDTSAQTYFNATKKTLNSKMWGNLSNGTSCDFYVGRYSYSSQDFYKGNICELRFSQVLRSDAWIKATYNSLWDTLLTYGSEETGGGAEYNSILFGMNF